jgi:hypothetical protein
MSTADQANLEGYSQGYDDGYADGAAMVQVQLDELRDQVRLVLWHHSEQLRDHDWRTRPRRLMGIHARTIADVRHLIDY